MILAGCALLIFLPIAFLPGSYTVLILAILECCLLSAYSANPIRLKDRGAWGVSADSMYAHVLPSLAAWFALVPFSSHLNDWWMLCSAALIALWQFPMGFRGLLGHQINDYAKDKAVGESTLAVNVGVDRSRDIIRQYLIPAEAIGTLAVFVLVQLPNLVAFAGLGLFSLAWYRRLKQQVQEQALKRLPTPTNIIGQIMRLFWAEWFALAASLSMVVASPGFWPVLPVYLLIRPSGAIALIQGGLAITASSLRRNSDG